MSHRSEYRLLSIELAKNLREKVKLQRRIKQLAQDASYIEAAMRRHEGFAHEEEVIERQAMRTAVAKANKRCA